MGASRGNSGFVERIDSVLGDHLESPVAPHHRRRLRRLGRSHGLEAPAGGWAAGEPPPRKGNRLDVLVDGSEALPAIAAGVERRARSRLRSSAPCRSGRTTVYREFRILESYLRALRSAERLVYLENRFLWSPEIVSVLAGKLRNPPRDDFWLIVLDERRHARPAARTGAATAAMVGASRLRAGRAGGDPADIVDTRCVRWRASNSGAGSGANRSPTS